MDEVKTPFLNKLEYKSEHIWMQIYKPETDELYILTEKNGVFTIYEARSNKKVTTSKDKSKIVAHMNEM